MVGVGVGFERVGQGQAVAREHAEIALDVAVDRVDDHGGAAHRVAEDVGEGRGFLVEQLLKYGLHDHPRQAKSHDLLENTHLQVQQK